MSSIPIVRLSEWLCEEDAETDPGTVDDGAGVEAKRSILEKEIAAVEDIISRKKTIRNEMYSDISFSRELILLTDSIEKMVVAMVSLENDPEGERNVLQKRQLIMKYTNAIKSIKEKLSVLLAGNSQIATVISRLNAEIEGSLRERVRRINDLKVFEKSQVVIQEMFSDSEKADRKKTIIHDIKTAREFVSRADRVFRSRRKCGVVTACNSIRNKKPGKAAYYFSGI